TGSYRIPLNADGIAVVQSWVDDPSLNYGIIIMDYINATEGLDLSSRETNMVSDRPKMTVTYVNTLNNMATRSNSTIEIGANEALQENISLISSYPNPFKKNTKIEYDLHIDLRVQITINNIEGRIVCRLTNEMQTAGHQTIVWNGKDDMGNPVKSGIYFIHFLAEETRVARKIILLK
ncbi:MAG: T9SS type A sorting domain-containing protein, partial [Cyclobacteriaceae bacterium]|nr:T9SS type A sorting domain-containing protein [Cyclobacteriaceae bacterium]